MAGRAKTGSREVRVAATQKAIFSATSRRNGFRS